MLHDIFDSFTEYADKFEDLHKKHPSTSFLLFNYPGKKYAAAISVRKKNLPTIFFQFDFWFIFLLFLVYFGECFFGLFF